jgi:hypothetical protein
VARRLPLHAGDGALDGVPRAAGLAGDFAGDFAGARVAGVRRGALRIYRSGGGIIYSSPAALTLANCTNVIAW